VHASLTPHQWHFNPRTNNAARNLLTDFSGLVLATLQDLVRLGTKEYNPWSNKRGSRPEAQALM